MRKSSLRDILRQSDGRLTVNGVALRLDGRCHCGCPLMTLRERETRVCVDHGAYQRKDNE